MPYVYPAVVRLDLNPCRAPTRHRTTTGTQTGVDLFDECPAESHMSHASGLVATVMHLVSQCSAEYETVARQQLQQLAGLQSVLGRLRSHDVDHPALSTHALEDATVEALARAAARDYRTRDEAVRKHLRWMQNACAEVCARIPSHRVSTVSAPRDENSRAGACAKCAGNCRSDISTFRSELQRGYFSRQLRLVHTECERVCRDAREQLNRALADAALASAREEEARGRCDQIVAELQEHVKHLEAANEKSRHELQRTRLKLHTARRKVLEQKWAQTYAEPLARELEAATAAADAAGVLPSQMRAERLQLNNSLPLSFTEGYATPQTTVPVPHHESDSNNTTSSRSTCHVAHIRQRRFSAPNVLFDFSSVSTASTLAGSQAEINARNGCSPSSLTQTSQAVHLAARSWAPVAGPRSTSVIAVVHALASVQVSSNSYQHTRLLFCCQAYLVRFIA